MSEAMQDGWEEMTEEGKRKQEIDFKGIFYFI